MARLIKLVDGSKDQYECEDKRKGGDEIVRDEGQDNT
jgi:hypothetical protein